MAEVANNLAMVPDRSIDPAAGLRLLAEWFKVHDRECRSSRDSEAIRLDLLRWADDWVGLRLQVAALKNRMQEDEVRQVALHESIVKLRKGMGERE